MSNTQQLTITPELVDHIAHLSNIPVSEAEKEELAKGFTKVFGVVAQLNSIDLTNVAQTNQVTGLVNVFRNDVVTADRTLSHEDLALNHTLHEGYLAVDQVREEK
jgi:aspartyl/glutamyl-tRNA(Asn/Gln) amidotransferase C subunit